MSAQPAMMPRAFGAPFVALALLLTAGCSSSSDNAQRPASDRTTSSAIDQGAAEPAPTSSDADTPTEVLDVCALLSAAEVDQYLAGADPGQSLGTLACEWRQPDTEETLTLTIGEAGTAADGSLDEPSDYGETETVPEIDSDARFVPGLNIIEFVVDDRLCELQVAVLGDGRAAAVALALLVRERV